MSWNPRSFKKLYQNLRYDGPARKLLLAERVDVALDRGGLPVVALAKTGGGEKGVVALGDPCEKTIETWMALTFLG